MANWNGRPRSKNPEYIESLPRQCFYCGSSRVDDSLTCLDCGTTTPCAAHLLPNWRAALIPSEKDNRVQ